jgi:hypothetical protein
MKQIAYGNALDLQAEGAGWEEDPASVETADLAGVIRGFYRILDLISERGSGGLGRLLPTLSVLAFHHVQSTRS